MGLNIYINLQFNTLYWHHYLNNWTLILRKAFLFQAVFPRFRCRRTRLLSCHYSKIKKYQIHETFLEFSRAQKGIFENNADILWSYNLHCKFIKIRRSSNGHTRQWKKCISKAFSRALHFLSGNVRKRSFGTRKRSKRRYNCG